VPDPFNARPDHHAPSGPPLSVLLVDLAAVGLLAGGAGVANTMVVSVPERRAEIALRRVRGGSRGQIPDQFRTEAVV
jgi:putative ABC transport system permease protein